MKYDILATVPDLMKPGSIEYFMRQLVFSVISGPISDKKGSNKFTSFHMFI